jgi:Flp pilus assembly protein CpaB
MNRRHLFIVLAVVVVVIVIAATLFTRNAVAPDADGASTANSATEQVELPAGPASEPAETTGNNP